MAQVLVGPDFCYKDSYVARWLRGELVTVRWPSGEEQLAATVPPGGRNCGCGLETPRLDSGSDRRPPAGDCEPCLEALPRLGESVLLVRVPRRNNRNRTNGRQIHVDYAELAHEIMEAPDPQDQRFASWRPGEADGVIRSKSEGLATRRAGGVNPCPGADEMSQLKE